MNRIIISTALFLISITLVAQNKSQSDDEIYFRSQTKTIASDKFAGRKPLTKYDNLTINYIADEFSKLGLKPGNGDSFFQKVPLLDTQTRAKKGITIKGNRGSFNLKEREDFVVWSPQRKKNIDLSNEQFVFVGFGINAPEYNHNDYEGLDVKGKIVVALVNDPGFYDVNRFRGHNMTYYGRWIYKFEEASRQGADGVLVIHDSKPASYGWNVVQNSWFGHNLELVSDKSNEDKVKFKGWITKEKANELFKSAGTSYDELFNKALDKNFKAVALNAKANIHLTNNYIFGNSNNIAAVLPGTDLKDEYVVYTAHWDHFGIGKPINGDSIYNGASDNASGVAALLSVARKFTNLQDKPRRSILFLSVTAEEAVLLGSEYYTSHPLIPLSKTAVNINFDGTAPKGHGSKVFIGAKGDSETDLYVESAAAAQGKQVTWSNDDTRGGYFRSDHFSFAKVGIPVVIAGTVPDENFSVWKRNTYHQPSDEYDDSWNVDGAIEDINLSVGIGLGIANADKFPEWNKSATYKRIY